MRAIVLPAVLLSALSVINPVLAQQPAATPAYTLKVVTDRPEAIYKTGEQATFNVTLTKDNQNVHGVELVYNLTIDGFKPVKDGTLKTAEATTNISGTLAEPGFLRIVVTCKPEGGQVLTAQAAGGFDPLLIKPSLPVPDDFDRFWSDQKRQLAAVAMNPKLTPVKSPNDNTECFDVKVDCLGGKPVSGYFARPKNAKPKSLPAVLFVHGAGVRSSGLATAAGEANRGRLAMDMNAHGIDNGQPADYYTNLSAGELKGYPQTGRDNRETTYFRGMYLRLVRGIDFLCSQPEWDGEIVIARGASQGGGQALAAAGLDARVTAIFAGVPALCDHSGNVVGRIAGWPKIVPLGADRQPDAKVLQAARYIDGMNFAARTKADAILSAGFIDGTCPPTSVYATYNNLTGHKEMANGPLFGHTVWPESAKQADAFLDAHIARRQAARSVERN